MDRDQRATISAICSHVHFDADMGLFTTLRTGGRAEALADIETSVELAALLKWLRQEKLPWRIIGGGSNLLIASRPYPGILIRLKGSFKELSLEKDQAEEGKCNVLVGGGTSMAVLAEFCRKQSITGLEWAVGIPGTVGGALAMNAGAHGYDMAGVVSTITMVAENCEQRKFTADELDFSYRSLNIPGTKTRLSRFVITGALLSLCHGDGSVIAKSMKRYVGERKAKQPKGASAGSFFKNPDGDAAGRLIDAAGLKGFSCGGAMVSRMHANFIVNTGTATPEDILALKDIVQQKVLEQSGILLEPEVHIL